MIGPGLRCYACEHLVRPNVGVAVSNLYDPEGTALPFHRVCVLRVVDTMPEWMREAIHHQIATQGVFADADAAHQKAIDARDPWVNPRISEIDVKLDSMPPATVPQRDSTRPGFDPDDE